MSTEPDGAPAEDPLAQITLTRRGFAAVLAVVGLLAGLVMALVPVHVAHPDAAQPRSVTCGNAIGGAETPWIVEDLGVADRALTVSYIDMCERAISERATTASLLFFSGLVGGLALGVVRRSASPGSGRHAGPAGP
ncbi:hypothetical protein [Actinokineospora iranica]|uniref:Uncharacterized protein n=1 Tax=Actinokineospora iranica TaxID=1271860 RepID=A0A1G6TJ25_9PSEU|nr:hypothetical protein [Actinokineospora iranica]SDD29029.1 hypothetical protein SAMN05216174_109170 [Actinokineospora iranica]